MDTISFSFMNKTHAHAEEENTLSLKQVEVFLNLGPQSGGPCLCPEILDEAYIYEENNDTVTLIQRDENRLTISLMYGGGLTNETVRMEGNIEKGEILGKEIEYVNFTSVQLNGKELIKNKGIARSILTTINNKTLTNNIVPNLD